MVISFVSEDCDQSPSDRTTESTGKKALLHAACVNCWAPFLHLHWCIFFSMAKSVLWVRILNGPTGAVLLLPVRHKDTD